MSEKEKIIKKYIDDNFTSNESSEIRKKYNEVKGILSTNWYEKIFISWSLWRWTSIEPLNDIDIICEIDKNKKENFKDYQDKNIKYLGVLEDIYNLLKQEYWKSNVKLQSHSIWILFWKNKDDFSIDIVPSIKLDDVNEDFWDNLYEVPEILFVKHNKRKDFYKNKYTNHKNIEWKKSDPKWYINKANNVRSINENFIYASVFLKRWKYIVKNSNSKFLKSFHIEEYIKNVVISNKNIFLIDLFKAIKDINIYEPNCLDRANTDIYIDDYVKNDDDFKKERLNIKKEIDRLVISLTELEWLSIRNVIEFLDTIFDSTQNTAFEPKPIKVNKPWSNKSCTIDDNNSLNLSLKDEIFIKKNNLK